MKTKRKGVEADGVCEEADGTTTITVKGESFNLNDKQIDQAAKEVPRFRLGGNRSAEQLKSIIERIERLEEEKASIGSDIKDIFAEAKGNGFDVKTIRKVLKDRKLDAAERDEEEHLYDTYRRALGMGPLFDREETEIP